jgi:hypothetical protein
MGKATRTRQDCRRHYLVRLSAESTDYFAYQWERRLDSWLTEIRLTAGDWSECGKDAGKTVFSILDEAMSILEDCGSSIYEKYAPQTYKTLCDACCQYVAGAIDPKMYKLSNMRALEEMAKYRVTQ